MRKTWIIAVAAAAVALAGCNREIQGPEGAKVFRASIETPSRVAFSDEGAFSWQAGDAVALSTNAGFKTFTLASGAGASVAAFDGDLSGVTSATVAIYPASIAKDDATVTLPAEYAWAEGQTNAAMFCSQVSLTEVNSFKHLGGIIKVTFAEIPAEADAMVLKAEAKITGDFAIADGKIAAGVGSDQVKVTFAAGSNPAAFYIPVPTGEYKFAVELQAAGATIEKSVKATTNAIKIDRKALVMMDPVGGPVKITIATVEDFLAFAAEGDTYPEGSEAVLTADITLPETFVPDTVAVNFDGQGHTITYALTLPEQSPAAYNGGVFSLYTGTIKNLKVAGTMNTETLYVGGIAGACGPESVFDHCESSVNITFPAYGTATPHIGGIVGNAGIDSQFIGCVNKGKLEYNVAARDKGRSTQIGGIAAYCLSRTLFKDCVNDGDLVYYAKGSCRLGGMVGYPDDLIDITFDGCVNNGHILVDVVNPASGYQYVGGLTGYYATNSTAVATAKVLYKDCVNNGKIEVIGISTAKGQARIGGIACYAGCTDEKMGSAGFANGSQCYEFDGCVNNGELITDGTVANNTAGGIVGFAESSAQVLCKNCTNKGKVSVAGTGSAGGIQGAKGGLNTVYTDCVVDAASVIEALGAGKVGLLCGNAAAYTGTFTGTIGPATIGKSGTQTVMASDNYKDFLFGAALGEGANTDGVVFEGPAAAPTIKDFAKEYVKILDVWAATTGEIVMHKDVPEETVANAHYVPETTTITVGGKEYNTADMFETALRSYLLIRGYNGLDAVNYGKDKIAALEGGALAMSTTEVPETHGYTWGEWPYNETSGNGGHLVLGTKDENEHCKVKTDILDNWAMRSLNYQKGKPVTNLCGYANGQLPGYYGCFCSKRALLTYAFFFKHMLDNNLDKGTEVADDVIIRSELFGDETPEVIPVQRDTTWLAEWWINDADKTLLNAHYAEEAKEPGTSLPNVAANAAGNGGQYVEPNKSGSGRIEFYNAVDKTSFNPKARVKRAIGTMAITEFGTWVDDYWLMTANPSAPVAAGEDIMVYFAMRANSKNTPKYWLAEIKDGSEWKPLLPTRQATFDGKTFDYNVEVFFDIPTTSEVNSEVDATYTLTQSNSEIVVRITCMSLKMAGGTDDVPVNIGDSVGGATENPVIMLVGERTNKNGAPITRHTGIAILK